jgi:uncharacterized protein YjbI with pentapeptide repeats
MRTILSIAAAMFVFANAAHADIFQWEYINPADPSQGKRQSTTRAPDGAGIDAVPGADLSYRNLTMAYLVGADLTGAEGYYANLTNADLSQANLADAYFGGATLSGTQFSEAKLTYTQFGDADLMGANFRKANLTNANFTRYVGCETEICYLVHATLTDANFADAEVKGANLEGTGITLSQLYSTASYQAHDLTGVNLAGNDLSGTHFASQNLTNANFFAASLLDADLTDAKVAGANFGKTGITLAQLYSTASYQVHSLSRIGLSYGNLSGAYFAQQNLAEAGFQGARLTDADFTGANIQGARFDILTERHPLFPGGTIQFGTGIALAQLYATASYHAKDMSGIGFVKNDLTGANFTGQNLANSSFSGATLTGADFTGAKVRGASFGAYFNGYEVLGTGITLAQLYSTASYQVKDLSGIGFAMNNFAGGNFAGQNFANAHFGYYTILEGADFTAADARGAYVPQFFFLSASTANLIRPDGHIDGLDLDARELLVVRDYDGDFRLYLEKPPIPITVDEHLTMASGGTLRTVFEADEWNSTISFAAGIPVTLGGTLELTFADNVNPASQIGRTFDLFDWTGVNPIGTFTVASPYHWDLSSLYTTGEVRLLGVPEPHAIAFLLVAIGARVIRRARDA